MTTVPPTPPKPKGAAKPGLTGWLEDHRTQAYIGAAGLVIAIALYVKSRDSAAAASTGTTAASTAVPTSTADTTGTDAYNGIEDQVLGLQSALLALQNPQTGSSVPSPTTSNPGPPSITPAVATAPALQPSGTSTGPAPTPLPATSAAGTWTNPDSAFSIGPTGIQQVAGATYPGASSGETSGEFYSIPGDPY